MSHLIYLLLYKYAVLHIAWPHLTDCIVLHWLYYSTLTGLHCTDFNTLHFTSPQRIQVKVHITVPHVTEAPFSVGSVWSGQPTLGIDRRGDILSLLSLLSSLISPCPIVPTLLYQLSSSRSTLPAPTCSLCASPSLVFSLCSTLTALISIYYKSSCLLVLLIRLFLVRATWLNAFHLPLLPLPSLLPFLITQFPSIFLLSIDSSPRPCSQASITPGQRWLSTSLLCRLKSDSHTGRARTQYFHEALMCVARK
jgi:hypothetical protein